MKKYLLLISLSLLLTACNTEEEPEATTKSEESEEIARLKEENEELKRQQAEQSKEQGTEDEQTKEKSETSKDEEDSASVEVTDSETSDRSSLNFDIDSPEVQAYINKNDNYDDEGNFIQDAISIGMSQTEVEDLYGKHDFTMMDPGSVAAVYENLAVLYSSQMPHGDGSDSTDSSIDPDSNSVEMILYFANITSEELQNALGSPDNQLQNLQGNQNYIYESNGWGSLIFSETGTPDGTKIGTMRGYEDNITSQNNEYSGDRYFDEYYTEGFPVTLSPEKDSYTYETMQGFIFKTYLNSLRDYYNGKDDELLHITTGSALEQVQENKESGNFSNYQNLTGRLLSAEQISVREYRVTVERSYSHASSGGQQTTQITYIIVDTDGMLKVSNF